MMEQSKPLYRMQTVVPAGSYDPVEGAIKAFRVNYVTASGVTDYVTIPEKEYADLERVKEIVQAAAAHHEHVIHMQGPPHTPGQPPAHPWNSGG